MSNTTSPDTKTHFDIVRVIVGIIRYWCVERIIGFGLLFYAVITAFDPLVSNTSILYISRLTGLNISIVSMWFLFSSLYLLVKGKDATFVLLLLCCFPLSLQIFSDVLYSIELRDGGYIAREVLMGGFIFRHMIIRLTNETFKSAGISTQLE